jgi:hypothetical protein
VGQIQQNGIQLQIQKQNNEPWLRLFRELPIVVISCFEAGDVLPMKLYRLNDPSSDPNYTAKLGFQLDHFQFESGNQFVIPGLLN